MAYSLLFGPGVRFYPNVVWSSQFFWTALAIMIVAILIWHNYSPAKRLRRWLGIKSTSTAAPAILYSNMGRSGYVYYRSAEADFELYFEFGGGDCVASIDIPSPEKWESRTGLPLQRRNEVLQFIGEQVVRDQTTQGRGYFKIEGDYLNIYV